MINIWWTKYTSFVFHPLYFTFNTKRSSCTGDFTSRFYTKIDLFVELHSKILIWCIPSSVRMFASQIELFALEILPCVTLTTFLILCLHHQNSIYWCLYNFSKKQVKSFIKLGDCLVIHCSCWLVWIQVSEKGLM